VNSHGRRLAPGVRNDIERITSPLAGGDGDLRPKSESDQNPKMWRAPLCLLLPAADIGSPVVPRRGRATCPEAAARGPIGAALLLALSAASVS
jgi:hypothetical protein